MGQLTLTIVYGVNTGLVYNASELKSLYFQGIPLNQPDGTPFPDDTIEFYIGAAQKEVENEMSIKLTRQAYQESRDFVVEDYRKFGYVSTLYPAVKGYLVQGFLNTVLQLNYPQEWVSTKSQSDQDSYWRSINLVPISGANPTYGPGGVYIGIIPLLGNGYSSIPNYWNILYLTGWLTVPKDLLNYIGKKASINLFEELGDLVSGRAGVLTQSISLDGLSQNLGTKGYMMRIDAYRKDIELAYNKLNNKYGAGLSIIAL